MNILWVTRSFLDYRIPVFEELDRLVGGRLTLLYSGDYVPERVQGKAQAVLGDRAIAMSGEWKLGREDREFMANRNVSLRYQPGIGRRIRELEPDVLVGDGFFKWTFPCLLERRRRGTPLVVCYERTAHTERGVQWYRRLYRKWALRAIDAMCCNGRLCSEYVQSVGFPGERISCGHMVADTAGLASACSAVSDGDKEALRRALNLAGTVILYVGRLIPLKGIDRLLSAWSGLDPDVREKGTLLLVGDGPERGQLETSCQAHGLANVRFIGAVEYDRIAPYYAVSDLFVMPTLEDNWSLVVPEAMACSLPILCSVYNGCWPELVTERNGWVFDPLDLAHFTQALSHSMEQREHLRAMGEASRAIVSQHTPKHAAEAVLQSCHIAIQRHA